MSLESLNKNIQDRGNGSLESTTDRDSLFIQEQILRELKIIRIHLELLTDESVLEGDIDAN